MNSMTLPTRANADVIESAYRAWLDNPDSVDPTWRAFFQGFTLGNNGSTFPGATAVGENAAGAGVAIIDSFKQIQVHRLINAYRAHGHIQAHLDPLSDPPPAFAKLEISHFGLAESDLDESFEVGHYKNGGQMKLRTIIESLRTTYSKHIGVEYLHVQDSDAREWLQTRME